MLTGVRLSTPSLPYCLTLPLGAYYAAQQGITLGASAPANHSFLSALLSSLESLRSSIGPSEAIGAGVVSTIYVEDFALRVFNAADSEDRKGVATRSTARKFMATAAFFEVLKVFEDKRAWESVRFSLSADTIHSLRISSLVTFSTP